MTGALSVLFVACVADEPATVAAVDGAVPTSDAPTSDVAMPLDAAQTDSADGAVAPTYFDVTDPNNWSSYDLSAVTELGTTAKAFGGGVLAGKYMYLPPAYAGNSVMFRYDTTAPFKTKSSWTTYDLNASVDPGGGYDNGVFDGTNLFIIPFATGKALRFDTTQSFVDPNSWKTYALAPQYAGAFGGQAFDGQYVYATGYSDHPSSVVRYDTKGAGFEDGGAWSVYNLGAVDASANVTFLSAPAFDKRYLYFGSVNDSNITRFDTMSSFSAASSWEVFDASSVFPGAPDASPVAMGLGIGAIFDGKYVYFPPYSNRDITSTTMRYDTTKPFAQKTSWDSFDLTMVDSAAINFHGGTFDGRYVYYPSYNQVGLLVRYDTTLPFTQKASWQSFRISGATANIGLYSGIVFDGEYIYLIPQGKAVAATELTVVRFHAKTPPSLPSFTSSFQ